MEISCYLSSCVLIKMPQQKEPLQAMASKSEYWFQRSVNPLIATHKMCLAVIVLAFLCPQATLALTCSFHGLGLSIAPPLQQQRTRQRPNELVMRKQKASDKHTARLQRGEVSLAGTNAILLSPLPPTQILSSGFTKNQWKDKKIELRAAGVEGRPVAAIGGRGRARKRLRVYNSLNLYHETFLTLISEEYRMEEAEVITRLESSIADPFSLEISGHALFDMHPQRRGNLFNDEVYRLQKAIDATTKFYFDKQNNDQTSYPFSPLPPNHKFARNDVIVLTLQPRGTGDFLGTSSLPTNPDAVLLEARVLNIGPTYIDVAVASGQFTQIFGPASNNVGSEGKGDPNLRVRVDRFFSNVPFQRMVAALGQLTSAKEGQVAETKPGLDKRVGGFQMDNLLKEVILCTFSTISDDTSSVFESEGLDLGDLPKKLAKPPLPNSPQLASQVMAYIQANPSGLFPAYNEPQLTAIRAALTRRLTMIQGPPGTGKTTTAGSIAFGFVHQCRNISPYCKVLATAFSNVGADNLAEKFLSLGLKVVRVGKPSGIAESLWAHTLDAAIQRDPFAQKALDEASKITAKVKISGDADGKRKNKGSLSAERAKRDEATAAVKASIQACNVAATKALREADVIVATSIGAADPQLLAACGIYEEEDDIKKHADMDEQSKSQFGIIREFAPDNLPPLSLPFVIIDEACQSVEPANLIPIVSTNSCRSLVMLGDPCQLPPTVRSDTSATGASPLSTALMSRLSSIPDLHPVTVTAQKDKTPKETKFIQCKPTRQAVARVSDGGNAISYRKRFSGSVLLSMQFRMHPSIAAFSSAIFYDGLLSSPLTLSNQRQFPMRLQRHYPVSNRETSVRFINVGGRNNENKGEITEVGGMISAVATSDPSNNSYRNEEEAHEIIKLLKILLRQEEGDSPYQGSIGIVTPYAAQVALIKSMMAKDDLIRTLVQSPPQDIEVKSVDAYQGRERDIIIFSAVRSNRRGRIGFLTDWRRMNVALTRAKNALIVIGDAASLKEGDKHWSAFVHWCESMGCFIEDGKRAS